MVYIVYNPLSNGGKAEAKAREINLALNGEIKDATHINFSVFLKYLNKEDEVYLVGGDGTLSRLINQIGDMEINNKLFLCPAGTGNDFATDINFGKEKAEQFICLNEYIKNLPTVTVGSVTKRFINGVGFGVDGMCCQIGEELREKRVEKINYTSIAIKQLLFSFKKKTAKITVDGKTFEHQYVWIAPTMKGRFYGGGMMVAPDQDRLNGEGLLTSVVFKGKSRLSTLIAFPSIFKGEHIKHTKKVSIVTGKEITVEFDEPTALQIDGDVIRNVKEYTVRA